MNKCAALILIFVCFFLSSCSEPAKVEIKKIHDAKREFKSNEVIIATDVGRYLGTKTQNEFTEKLTELTRQTNKKVTVISYIEFVCSDYNKQPDRYPDILFVFATPCGERSVVKMHYLIEAGYLGWKPFIIIDMTVIPGKGMSEAMANSIFNELKEQSII